jgi:hypothetical protein
MKYFLTLGAAALAVCALMFVPGQQAAAFERSAMSIQFNPAEDTETRYLFTLFMAGTYVSPGRKDQMAFGEYAISTVYKDTVTDSLPGQNRHRLDFLNYYTRALDLGSGDRSDQRFGGSPFPNMGGGGNGGGGNGDGGGGGDDGDGPPRQFSAPGPGGDGQGFVNGLGLPEAGKGTGGGGTAQPQGKPGGQPSVGPKQLQLPMQGGGGPGGGGGGGGGPAGSENNNINLNAILINQIDYVTNKQGEVLDIGGLDLLRKVSSNNVITETEADDEDEQEQFIDINIGHVFEWTHMLYLPTYPIYKEDIWFHSLPIHVPGLPPDQPVLSKFMYKLIDFRTVGTRKVAVIDMSGVVEWNQEWEKQSKLELTEFKSWGNMGVSARIWYDYEKNVIFAMERPPFYDFQYQRYYQPYEVPPGGGGIPYAQGLNPFTIRYPGLVISMEFFYNTRETDISGKPRLVEVEPKERRRYVALNMVCQLEAE